MDDLFLIKVNVRKGPNIKNKIFESALGRRERDGF